MSSDQIHHSAIATPLNQFGYSRFYQQLYPNQGRLFGMTDDFSAKLPSSKYRASNK